jgi:Domain of unknown function (DUF4139)/N-terminal domain of unknown function (DUF4140)
MWKCCCLLAGLAAGAVLLAMFGSAPSPAGAVPPGATVAKVTDQAAQPKMATSRVTKVTVYPNSALVSREVVVPPGNGTIELVVAELPEQTMNGSLYSEATEGLRVLSTRFRTRAVKEDTRDEVRKLVDEQKSLMLAAQKIEADVKTTKENLELLTKLEKFTTVTTVSATEKGTLSGDTVITLSKYVMEKRGEKSKELVSLQQDLLTNQEQAQFVKRKLDELRSGSSKTERDAVIVVDRHNGGGKLWLNYLFDSVTWKPQYKLRAGKAQEPILVDYLAAVVQHTGEEWRNVDMILSTAQPMLSAAPPELKMLEVAVVSRASVPMPSGASGAITFVPQKDVALDKKANDLRVQARQELYSNNFDVNGKLLNSASAWEQGKEMMCTKEELLAKQRNPVTIAAGSVDEGPSVTFHLGTRLTIPSRNDEQVIEVAKLNLAPKFYYKAVPVLTRHVYRLADLTNKSEHILLPGEATMYQGTDFVGRMTMPLVAIGEDLTVGFGIDPQLQIQRQMLDTAKTTQGGNQVLKYEYRILVNSFKTEPVKVQVWDRLPHAATETAGVNLLKTTPELSKDALYLRESRPNNLLRWDLEVEPTMNGERAVAINYEFKLELDRQMLISSFMTK